mgnify:FL=1
MSGAAGGVPIKKKDLKDTIRDYRDKVLKPLNLDTSYKITGVRSRPSKSTFGDIDIVVSFPSGDKKQLKKDIANFLEGMDQIPQLPHKANKKSFIHGQIVTTLWPVSNQPGEYVQIDNIVTVSKDEGEFTYGMLDLPAQEQGLILGLAKTIFSELSQNEIQQLFKSLNIPEDVETPQEGEEYDFNLNTSGLSLKISPMGGKSGRVIWNSNSFQDVKTLIKSLGIDIERDKFDSIIEKVKKFKSRRSIDRLKGMFARNIRVGTGEIGKEKGDKKQQSLDRVAALEEKYGTLAVELIKPLLTENEDKYDIALMPGAFKPPHRDHLLRINAAANLAKKAIILISPIDRTKPNQEPISAQQSLDIWNLYKSKGVLNSNIEFIISPDKSPVKTTWDIVKDNPNNKHLVIYGKGEDVRYKGIKEKYPNVETSDLGLDLNLSASDLRTALINNKDITPFLPNNITPEEYKQALNIQPSITEGMRSKSLFSTLLERENNIVAFFGGGFKPPTKTHFLAVKKLLENNPEIDKVSIIIDKGLEDNISQDEAYSIWNIYKKYLPIDKVEIIKANSSPISYIKNYVKNNTDHISYIVIGPEGDRDDEIDKFSQEKDILNKYGDHIKIKYITAPDNVTGEKAREAANKSQENFNQFLPNELTYDEKNTIYSYIQSSIQEQSPDSQQPELKSKPFSYQKHLKSLTKFMLEVGLNISPLPNVKFIKGDTENASDFFGKTAYYDPNSHLIVLYTLNRHPKDVMRSFAHEMIHHMQNCENRLGTIKHQDTTKDTHLDEIEREAYEKGNIIFRNWADTLTKIQEPAKEEDIDFKELEIGTKLSSLNLEEAIVGDKIECDNCDWSWDIKDGGDDLYICHKCNHDNTPQLNEGRYDKSSNQISKIVFEKFKDIYNQGDKKGEFTLTVGPNDEDILNNQFEFDLMGVVEFTGINGEYLVDGGANAGFDSKGEEITPLMSIKFRIPTNPDWQQVSFDIKDVVRHELEHLTQDGENVKGGAWDENPKLRRPSKYMKDDQLLRDLIDAKMLPKAQYFKLEKEVDAMLQGLYFKAKKSKRPFKDVVNDYLNIFIDQNTITLEEKEEIINIWRARLPSLNLPKF